MKLNRPVYNAPCQYLIDEGAHAMFLGSYRIAPNAKAAWYNASSNVHYHLKHLMTAVKLTTARAISHLS